MGIKLERKHLGSIVELENGNTGRITVFDGSSMPAYVRHDVPHDGMFGTWHLEDGKSYGVKGCDIVKILDSKEERNENQRKCSHVWQNYHGIIESYQFCTICDKKRNL